jgi:hypothetical protein
VALLCWAASRLRAVNSVPHMLQNPTSPWFPSDSIPVSAHNVPSTTITPQSPQPWHLSPNPLLLSIFGKLPSVFPS